MKIQQAVKQANRPFEFQFGKDQQLKKPLVLVFGNRFALENEAMFEEVRTLFPEGHLVFGSTSGEIVGESVLEGTVTVTAIAFEKSHFLVKSKNVKDITDDYTLGKSLFDEFPKEGLKHVFLVSEGSTVNGSALINGFQSDALNKTSLSGGLCGDDDRFERTLASYNEKPKEGEVVAIGFYGESLEISSANYGGWTPFGPERIITKSKNNVLYELDGQPALDLYKRYLGEKAKELPTSALLFPLSVRVNESDNPIVRTILTIDEEMNTMTLAGDVPEGSRVQLMMSTVDDIAEAANIAAQYAMNDRKTAPEVAILVSCVGRKLVMDQRTEEEVEEVISVIGDKAAVTGFYSYGEMAPFAGEESCKLHNQTMTLTLFSE
ncbi:FIST signal transduction protein [Zobellia galactanivorans]|uniref:FIST signal transduction protein n=1 Tax=Zobellia galactanivorans (strain DSM 12802 / CCUG 47099 / CIP 106680 / NCIMB 13871 / Dsij) TaxID=63186 RepID=UPI001C06B0DB|nr:FIST N-terminal domain-containing protein [Zobellia galactanivorans]MBU3025107.1 FIST C-terminal domain-containing protein [Zobellia galactanivorans]